MPVIDLRPPKPVMFAKPVLGPGLVRTVAMPRVFTSSEEDRAASDFSTHDKTYVIYPNTRASKPYDPRVFGLGASKPLDSGEWEQYESIVARNPRERSAEETARLNELRQRRVFYDTKVAFDWFNATPLPVKIVFGGVMIYAIGRIGRGLFGWMGR